MSIIDISTPLNEATALWPGSEPLRLGRTMSIERGDEANVSSLSLDLHAGTHIEAPLHFIEHGASVDSIALEVLCGKATVADLSKVRLVTRDHLAGLDLGSGVERLLLKTDNSALYSEKGFNASYVALDEAAAAWVVESAVRLIGIDYLSIQPYKGSSGVHRILLEAGVVVVEGLNLTNARAGVYELICLPLKIMGTEGAPARAILRELKG